MNIEQEELNERYNKIENFVQSKEIDEIKSEESQFLIRIQRWIMNIYLSILSNRIMNEKHNETKFHHTFEEALLGMKSGCRMKRSQWKDCYAYFRAMVTQDSVEHAFRIHNEKTLEDNPWVPNTDDLINEDWELVKKK